MNKCLVAPSQRHGGPLVALQIRPSAVIAAMLLFLPGTPAALALDAAETRPAGNSYGQIRGGEQYRQAEALHKRNLDERERKLGKDHPYTLTAASSLAAVYKAQLRYGEAEALYQRVLESSERTLGKRHFVTLAAVDGLASLYKIQGRGDEAEQLYKRKFGGNQYPDTQ